ncbi:MAG: type IV pilin-like G/H family protein [Thermosynechococcaceae cyanobacterium]
MRQQEGKVSVSTMGRAQQAYFLENSKYAKSLDDLDIALTPQDYDLAVVEVTDKQVIVKATPREAGMKSYIGGVAGISQRIVCASDAPGIEIANPVFQNQAWTCAGGSTQVE